MPYRSTVTQVEPLSESGEFKLKKTVFLGYTDIAAGGIRTLLGIDLKKEFMTVELPELSTARLACECMGPLDPREQGYAPFQLWNLKYEEFSVILVNTNVKAEQCHYVCSKIMDLCTKWCIDKLIVLSALRVDIATEEELQLYENVINDLPLTDHKPLPSDTKMNDPFLSTLIQMVQVDYIPTCFLIIPAHRACTGTARDTDGSIQVIEKFQQVINKATKIHFNKELSLNLVYKGENEEEKGSVSMIYS